MAKPQKYIDHFLCSAIAYSIFNYRIHSPYQDPYHPHSRTLNCNPITLSSYRVQHATRAPACTSLIRHYHVSCQVPFLHDSQTKLSNGSGGGRGAP